MIKKQYFKEMNSRIKSIVWVFLTVRVIKVNIYSFWVATLTWAAGDALINCIVLKIHTIRSLRKRKRKKSYTF
jgi:hypothetical protein